MFYGRISARVLAPRCFLGETSSDFENGLPERRPKRRQMDRVQWEVRRERCRLDAAEAPCDGDARLIADDVMNLVRTRLESPEVRLRARVVSEWLAAVGAEAAAHAVPGPLRQGVLTVEVDSSAWLNELSRMHSRSMLSGMRQRLGPNVVLRLAFRVNAGAVKEWRSHGESNSASQDENLVS